jgi:hypothetical protein
MKTHEDVVSVEKAPHECEEGFTKDAPSVCKSSMSI